MDRRENVLKKYLLKIIGTTWHVQSHEDSLSTGIADLSYAINGKCGWIELKQIEKWAVKELSLNKPDKFTPSQVGWLKKRGRHCQNVYILVKIGKDEYFLFDYTFAREVRKGLTKDQYYFHCRCYWKNKIDKQEFINIITE